MLLRAAQQWPWISIIQSSLELIFQIGAVPLRFFHGDAERPALSRLHAIEAEVGQLRFAFGERPKACNRIFIKETFNGDGSGLERCH
jgi:hypothetical protein